MSEVALSKALLKWSEAYRNAHENPRLLLKNSGNIHLCIQNMTQLKRVELDLIQVAGQLVAGLPKPLLAWLDARKGVICNSCRLSSSSILPHVECNDNMVSLKDATKKLYKFITEP